MATTPTNNPVPSNSPRDLLYNAERMDFIINSQNLIYTDRLGVERFTWAGAEADNAARIGKTLHDLVPLGKQYFTLASAQADIASGVIPASAFFMSEIPTA